MRPIHCLFDIETIGSRDGAPIVQLGAVLFSPFGSPVDFDQRAVEVEGGQGVISAPGSEFRMNVQVSSDALHFADWATIKWWLLNTTDEARRRVFAEPERERLRDVLLKFATWSWGWGAQPTYWWSDMDFDLRLVRQAYRMEGEADACPFGSDGGPHRGVRDYRTLRWLGKSLGVEQAPRVGVEHDALDDAHHQAGYVIAVLRRLGIEA